MSFALKLVYYLFRTKAKQTGKHLRGDRSSGDASARPEVVPVERQTVPEQDTVTKRPLICNQRTKLSVPFHEEILIIQKFLGTNPDTVCNCSYAKWLIVVESERDDFFVSA